MHLYLHQLVSNRSCLFISYGCRDTELGKKQAARAAEEAQRATAAITIQAAMRRRLAQKQV